MTCLATVTQLSLVPRPLLVFVTLKNWEWPGDETRLNSLKCRWLVAYQCWYMYYVYIVASISWFPVDLAGLDWAHTVILVYIIGNKHEWAPHLFVQRKFVCPCDHLSVWLDWTYGHAQQKKTQVVAHAQHNATGMTELYCSVVHTWCNTTNLDRRGRRAREEVSSVHVGLNVTESKQDREDSGRDLVPEHRKDLSVQTKRAQEGSEQHACRLQGNREQSTSSVHFQAICCPLPETTLSQFHEQ